MLQRIVLMTLSVLGAASMVAVGSPITTMTVKSGTHKKVGTSVPASVTHLSMAPPMRRIAPIPNRRRLPDLVIRSAVIRPAPGTATAVAMPTCRPGAPVLYVTARVQNIGPGPSAAKPSVGMVQARVTGGVNWGNGHGLPALAPGAAASVTFPIYYLQSNPGYMHGTHTFKLTVNAGKWVHESNYANNGFRPVRITLPPDFCGSAKSPKTHKQAYGGSRRGQPSRMQPGAKLHDRSPQRPGARVRPRSVVISQRAALVNKGMVISGRPSLRSLSPRLSCKVWGSPEEFPEFLKLTNTGAIAITAGTHVHWTMRRGNPRPSGNFIFAHTLVPGRSVVAPGVKGGYPAGALCTVSVTDAHHPQQKVVMPTMGQLKPMHTLRPLHLICKANSSPDFVSDAELTNDGPRQIPAGTKIRYRFANSAPGNYTFTTPLNRKHSVGFHLPFGMPANARCSVKFLH